MEEHSTLEHSARKREKKAMDKETSKKVEDDTASIPTLQVPLPVKIPGKRGRKPKSYHI